MLVQNVAERDSVLGVVWLSASAQASINKYVDGFFITCLDVMRRLYYSVPLPLNLPWSQSFYLCCQDVRAAFHIFLCLLIPP